MKRTVAVLLAACMLLCVLNGCGIKSAPEPASETEDTQPSAAPTDNRPPVEYDEKTQTVYVNGIKDYTAFSFPDEIKNARVLEVKEDAFQLHVDLRMLREAGLDEQTELPGLIDRTAESLNFLRQYLRENAGAVYPAALADLPVVIQIDRPYGYHIYDEQITLKDSDVGTHREFLYLLALMDCDAVGWEQFGYAWYVGTCIDPYNEVIYKWPIVPELPYYTQCIAGGIDPANVTAADFRTIYDACTRVCFEKGLTHWGSYCESMPVTAEPDFSRTGSKDPGDTKLTAFTAASFIAWLVEAYGFEQVSLFCFGQKTFEEAFGVKFNLAYKTWSNWIIQTYPASE